MTKIVVKYPGVHVPEHEMKPYRGEEPYYPEHEGEWEPEGQEHCPTFQEQLRKANKPYARYTEKNGHHFTDGLAVMASSKMHGPDGEAPTWTPAKMRRTMEAMSHALPDNVTVGDLVYAANMGYSDLRPEFVKDEMDAYRYAMKVAADPDGYKGMIFMRWVADAMATGTEVDFEKYM